MRPARSASHVEHLQAGARHRAGEATRQGPPAPFGKGIEVPILLDQGVEIRAVTGLAQMPPSLISRDTHGMTSSSIWDSDVVASNPSRDLALRVSGIRRCTS